jgi:hypothetical protein
MRKKIFFLAWSLDARCWLSKSSDPFPCSKQYSTIQITIMIDTQQQYIKLNIRGEISIIVVQAHSGSKRDICT